MGGSIGLNFALMANDCPCVAEETSTTKIVGSCFVCVNDSVGAGVGANCVGVGGDVVGTRTVGVVTGVSIGVEQLATVSHPAGTSQGVGKSLHSPVD